MPHREIHFSSGFLKGLFFTLLSLAGAIIAFIVIAALTLPAHAQSSTVSLGTVVTVCGNQTYTAGTSRAETLDTTGVECVTGTVTIVPNVASFTNRSGNVTVGGTAQTLAIANTSRKRIQIENPCSATTQNIVTAESLFINFTTAASGSAGNSIELVPCGSYDSGSGPVTGELISVVAATTSHRWIAKEQ